MEDIGLVLRVMLLAYDFDFLDLNIKRLEDELNPAGKDDLVYYRTRLTKFLELTRLKEKSIAVLNELEDVKKLLGVRNNTGVDFNFCYN